MIAMSTFLSESSDEVLCFRAQMVRSKTHSLGYVMPSLPHTENSTILRYVKLQAIADMRASDKQMLYIFQGSSFRTLQPSFFFAIEAQKLVDEIRIDTMRSAMTTKVDPFFDRAIFNREKF